MDVLLYRTITRARHYYIIVQSRGCDDDDDDNDDDDDVSFGTSIKSETVAPRLSLPNARGI